MEYFGPQWKKVGLSWNTNQNIYNEQCSKCGKFHHYNQCMAVHRICYFCHQIGHLARVCFSKVVQNGLRKLTLRTKSEKKKSRDKERYDLFVRNRNICQQLPFYRLNNTAFKNIFDPFIYVKEQLKATKLKLQQSKCTISKLETIAYGTSPDSNKTNNFLPFQTEKHLNTNAISKSVNNEITDKDYPIKLKQEYETLTTKYDELMKENEIIKYVLLDFEQGSDRLRQEISRLEGENKRLRRNKARTELFDQKQCAKGKERENMHHYFIPPNCARRGGGRKQKQTFHRTAYVGPYGAVLE